MNIATLSTILIAVTSMHAHTHYMFYRGMPDARGGGSVSRRAGGRRVFGGQAQPLQRFGAACALLDLYFTPRCSAAVVAPRWALTAAHCLSPLVRYVQYNTPRPATRDGDVVAVHYLYKHPEYKVETSTVNGLPDVTLLHHDVGLVRTRRDMALLSPTLDLVAAMPLHNTEQLRNQEVEVLGFGHTERGSLGEQLYSVKLLLAPCARGDWLHCACGVRAGARGGVCAGDSGGPVLWRGVLVAITSMGPLRCAGGAGGAGDASVFTSLFHYSKLINDTIHNTEAVVTMQRLDAGDSGLRLNAELLIFCITFDYCAVTIL